MTILFTIDVGKYSPKYELAATYAEARNKVLDSTPGSDPVLVDACMLHEFDDFSRLFMPEENGDQVYDKHRYFLSVKRPDHIRAVSQALRVGRYRNLWTVLEDWRGLSWVRPGLREDALGYLITKAPWVPEVVEQLNLLY